MSYQNINQYNFRRWGLVPVREISDICLASDERDYDQEVVFSPLLIGELDGNRLPFRFDFNSSGTTIAQSGATFSADTIVSENYWNPTNTDPNFCAITTELCDVGLTGIDNGLVKHISGETIEITTGLYSSISDKFSRYKYDRRMKLHPITGFTTTENRLWNDNSYSYELSYEKQNETVGYYAKLDGGFFQGFYKIAGYDYEVFPVRPNWGWTAEFVLRYRWTGDTSVGLNARYPDNKGTFFFYGARAENKFYHYADGSPIQDTGYTRVTQGLTCMKTCGCASSANTASTCIHVYQISGGSSSNCSCGCPCACSTEVLYPEKDPLYDGVSNAMSLRLSGDTGNPRLCVKTYRITGACETSGTCLTGLTFVTGTSVTEWCSTKGIFDICKDTPYIDAEHWAQIDAVFQRYAYFDECDLLDKGGLGLIVKKEYTATTAHNSLSLIMPPITHDDIDPATTEVVNFNGAWFQEREYRLGALKLYVNGKLFAVLENFEEIIPRLLSVEKEKQIGVGYNISIGGGTQGLHDNLTLSGGCHHPYEYQQDPECLTTYDLDNTIYSGLTTNIKLEQFFGGSMIGDVSRFNMYVEPLNASQVRHNFNVYKNKYSLLYWGCPDCAKDILPTPTNTPTQTLTPTNTPTPTATEPTYYYYNLLSCIGGPNRVGRSIISGLSYPNTYRVATNTCYTIVGIELGTYFDYDLDSSLLVSDCSVEECTGIAPSPTPTQTPTESETPTNTPTQTETPTQTPTPTESETPTPTSTQTPTPTESETPTPTQTETPTQTPTESETPTNTPTQTETPTQTQTPTESETPTPTPTVTETPTQTQTPTESETPTPTLTQTQTPTESETPTPTETPTQTITPSQTETPTQTPTNTETPTQTQTQSETPTSTLTPTPTSTDTNFLLQEDYSTLDQEDNNKILIT